MDVRRVKFSKIYRLTPVVFVPQIFSVLRQYAFPPLPIYDTFLLKSKNDTQLMKPILFKVTENTGTSFHVQENRDGHQYNQLHYHPEYQFSLIVAGSGKCTIGGYNDRFEQGDVYVIGANVPHIFESPDSHIISVFFTESSFGGYFFQLPEMAAVKQFLEEAAQSFKLQKKLAQRVQPLFLELLKLSGAARIIQLLQLLNKLALSADKQLLAQTEVSSSYSYTALYRRMKKAFRYIADNFDKEISLDDVAHSVHLSRYAFCRYFKKITNKSFVHYLNEFRVKSACKFLLQYDYTITQISFLCGFNNLSNFNRQFKKLMHCTPSEYRAGQV